MDAEHDPERDGYWYNGESKEGIAPVLAPSVEEVQAPADDILPSLFVTVETQYVAPPTLIEQCLDPLPRWTEEPGFPCRCSFCWRNAVGFHQTIAIAWCENHWSIAKHRLISFGASPI